MQRQHAPRDARQADAGDARRHAGEELRHQRARQADRLEVHAAAIGGQHADAHLGHHLQQALVHRLLVAARRSPASADIAEQAAAVAVGDALLRQIGVHRGGAGADQHGEVVHVHALGGAHVQRGEGAQRRACTRCVCTPPTARIIGIAARSAAWRLIGQDRHGRSRSARPPRPRGGCARCARRSPASPSATGEGAVHRADRARPCSRASRRTRALDSTGLSSISMSHCVGSSSRMLPRLPSRVAASSPAFRAGCRSAGW